MCRQDEDQPLHEMEKLLWENCMELGRLVLQANIDARGRGDLGESLIAADGGEMNRTRAAKTTLKTCFGEIQIHSTGYARKGLKSVHPKKEILELPAQNWSYELQARVCREAMRGPYPEASRTLAMYTAAEVSPGEAAEIAADAARDFEAFYLRQLENKAAEGRPTAEHAENLHGGKTSRGICKRTNEKRRGRMSEAVLKLRTIDRNGDWEEYWEFHKAEEKERLYPAGLWKAKQASEKPALRLLAGGRSA